MDQFIKVAGTEGKIGGYFAGCRLLKKTLKGVFVKEYLDQSIVIGT